MFYSKQWKRWLEDRKREVYKTGWRPHGAKVGDKVIFRGAYDSDWDDDQFIEVVKGVECWGSTSIESGSIGIITEIHDDDFYVTAHFEAVIDYASDDDKITGTLNVDDYEIRLPIDPDEDGDRFELMKPPPKPDGEQLSFLDGEPC